VVDVNLLEQTAELLLDDLALLLAGEVTGQLLSSCSCWLQLLARLERFKELSLTNPLLLVKKHRLKVQTLVHSGRLDRRKLEEDPVEGEQLAAREQGLLQELELKLLFQMIVLRIEEHCTRFCEVEEEPAQ